MYVDHSYTYEYDGNGNITTKKTYAYTTGSLGSVEDTVTYSYGNSDDATHLKNKRKKRLFTRRGHE